MLRQQCCLFYTHVINSLPVVDLLPGLQRMLPEKVIVLRTSHPQILVVLLINAEISEFKTSCHDKEFDVVNETCMNWMAWPLSSSACSQNMLARLGRLTVSWAPAVESRASKEGPSHAPDPLPLPSPGLTWSKCAAMRMYCSEASNSTLTWSSRARMQESWETCVRGPDYLKETLRSIKNVA